MKESRRIAVVGGGIFGVMTALELARRGLIATVFEKEKSVLLGASYINQNRLHMGYHYPRSPETARAACIYQREFQERFPEAVVDDFQHYYCVARDGSLVSGEEFLHFCDSLRLPYQEAWPQGITLNHELVEKSMLVPEKLYDANVLRAALRKALAGEANVETMLETKILGVNQFLEGYEIHFQNASGVDRMQFDAVVNATYSNINRLITMLGEAPRDYQFELCEMVVVKAPWSKRVGCGIMDGPFFGILPFGKSGSYLLYDVELSVLARSHGTHPEFERDIQHYDQESVKRERFSQYIAKASKYIAEMKDCLHMYSTYVPRVVLANRDKDDARPTELLRHGRGVWSIFAGKVSLAIPTARTITDEIEAYLGEDKPVRAQAG